MYILSRDIGKFTQAQSSNKTHIHNIEYWRVLAEIERTFKVRPNFSTSHLQPKIRSGNSVGKSSRQQDIV